MRAGFNWELGPFEMWDAIGVLQSVERLRARSERISPQAETLLASGKTSWYHSGENGRTQFDLAARNYKPITLSEGIAKTFGHYQAITGDRHETHAIAT